MEKFLKSRFFVFIVILTLSLVLIPAALSLAGVSSPIRSAISSARSAASMNSTPRQAR